MLLSVIKGALSLYFFKSLASQQCTLTNSRPNFQSVVGLPGPMYLLIEGMWTQATVCTFTPRTLAWQNPANHCQLTALQEQYHLFVHRITGGVSSRQLFMEPTEEKKDQDLNIQKVSEFLLLLGNIPLGRLSGMIFILDLAHILLLHLYASQLSLRDRN